MKSENFEMLRNKWPELASLGGFAEAYAHTDPVSALVKLRVFGENLTKDIYRDLKLPKPDQAAFIDLLKGSALTASTPQVILDKLHALRIHGNKAAHGDEVQVQTSVWLIEEAFDLAKWLCVRFDGVAIDALPSFTQPSSPDREDSEGELKRAKRQLLEKLAAREKEMENLLEELETTRQNAGRDEPAVDPADALQSGSEAVDFLQFDEATTRTRIIDSMLAVAGWDVGPGETSTSEVGKEVEVQKQPTTSGIGYADYVLWDDDGTPLAVIEAKKTSVNAETGRQQAKLYADGLEQMHGHRPVIFYTNGYDVWMWDDEPGYPPRSLFGYYSKDSLQYLGKFQRSGRKPLDTIVPREDIVDRLYQVEAIKRVSERFTDKHRKALIVQATGSGKTRVAIALADLLIRAGWVKRVLFLCDRRELRKQAKNAFGEFLSEPVRVVTGRVNSSAPERIFIATYPAMQRAYQSFDVGFFDLIIADESHRSIYNVYGDMFHYFDALQIGLTATPVKYMSRNTFGLFGCEDEHPTANYDLEQGVEDKWLTPFEVYEHTTQFLREGIRLESLTEEQIKQLEEQGEDPADYDFAPEEVDKAIYNKDTNRAILTNLMENGIQIDTEQVPGKSIIFARNHEHAALLQRLFDDMYPQYGGKFCQVIDNYDPRAEQLIDDFKGARDGKNDELTIAISVDMLDTGIDVPEIVNLVFAKPVKSPVKFWQMIGRGTRLRPDLFGPGQDKKVFRIFDHWENFERFETDYKPAEPAPSKSLAQLVFEERLNLADTALQKSEITDFDRTIDLIARDLEALPEDTVAVRQYWREKRAVSVPETLKSFDAATVVLLRQTIAPLMQWRDIRGSGEALRLDLLVTRMQTAVIRKSSTLDDLKIQLLDRVARLIMNLSQVKDKAEVIKRVKSDEFWEDVSASDLEEIRVSLREIIHLQEKWGGDPLPPKVIDVADAESAVLSQRSTNLKTVDMRAYREAVEAALQKHFESDPVLQKIRKGQSITEGDIQSLKSLVLADSPNVSPEVLEEFFADTARPLDFAIREIVGMDAETVEATFAEFSRKHPALGAKQTRFLSMIQNHIARYGSITIDRLYEKPFTTLDADGLEGVFGNDETTIEDLLNTVSVFTPPAEGEDPGIDDPERMTDE